MIRFEDEEKKTQVANVPDDRLLKTRSILLSGEVTKESADAFIRNLLILEHESSDPVKVFINSPGGDVDAGFAIYDMIRFVSCPVIIIGMGLVASAAALILLAVPSERRIGLPDSSYLIHQPLSKMRGVATDVEIHAKQLEKCREKINSIIAEACGQDIKKVSSDTERDYWLSADEAVSYGLISRIVSNRAQI